MHRSVSCRQPHHHPHTSTPSHQLVRQCGTVTWHHHAPSTSRSTRCAAAQLVQSADSWGLECNAQPAASHTSTSSSSYQHQEPVVPLVLLVDGTNIGSISAGRNGRSSSSSSSRIFRPSTEERFAAWLDFLTAFVGSSSSSSAAAASRRLAAVLVAFDNKGSSATNVRAQLLPNYLSKRYPQSAAQTQQQTPRPVTAGVPQAARSSSSAAAAAFRAPGTNLSGWGDLAGVVEQLNNSTAEQQQQQQQQQQKKNHASSCRYQVAHAAYGFEADDVLAAAAEWCRTKLTPQPLVVIASSDSDMQQLLDDSTYVLELLQVVSAQHPSGLVLHSAAGFRQQYGFEPAAYPDYLALVGKKEASIPSVGISAKLAKTLLAKFGSLDNILASRSLLKPFGAAHRLLGEGQPGADARCVTAARNLAVLRMRPQQQQLPVQQLQECYSQACASLQGPGMLQPQNMQPAVPPQQQQPQQRQEQQLQQQQMKKSQRGSFELPPQPDTSLLHPARQLHMQQCRPYLQTLQECLREVGWTQQLPNWRSPSGLWCDLLVQVPAHEPHQHDHHQQHEAARVAAVVALTPAAAGVGSVSPAGSATSSSGRDVAAPARARAAATGPLEGGTNWVAFQVLSPGDLCSGAVLPVLVDAGCTFESAADMLGQQLADKCGCMRYGTSALGHPKRSLLKEASGGAKRQLTLLKCIGMPLIVVPFFELLGTQAAAAAAPTTSSGRVCGTTTDGPDDGGDKDRALQYVQAVLREHCHLAGAFHC